MLVLQGKRKVHIFSVIQRTVSIISHAIFWRLLSVGWQKQLNVFESDYPHHAIVCIPVVDFGHSWWETLVQSGYLTISQRCFFHFLTNGYIFKGQGQSKKLTILSSLLARFTCQCFSRYSVCNPEEICLQRIDFRGHQFELYLAVKPCFCDIIPSNSQIGENIVRSRKTCNYTVLYCISFRKVNKIRYFFSYYPLPCLHCFHFWS